MEALTVAIHLGGFDNTVGVAVVKVVPLPSFTILSLVSFPWYTVYPNIAVCVWYILFPYPYM